MQATPVETRGPAVDAVAVILAHSAELGLDFAANAAPRGGGCCG